MEMLQAKIEGHLEGLYEARKKALIAGNLEKASEYMAKIETVQRVFDSLVKLRISKDDNQNFETDLKIIKQDFERSIG